MGIRGLGLVAVLGMGGCTGWLVEWADRAGAEIQAEKMGVVRRFRSDLADPTTGRDKGPGPESEYEHHVEVPKVLKLEDAIRIATRYSRRYIAERESFFLSMLSLDLTRHSFHDPIFSGSISWGGSTLENAQLEDSTTLALSGSKLLPTGGSVSVSTSGSLSNSEINPGERHQSSSVSASLSFSQPLLRGAGRTIAWEGLTQAERSAVYRARSFETFRQDFAVDILNRYYGLVSQKKGLENTRRNVANQEYTLKQARALYRLQRGKQQDVFRAEQAHRDAQNTLLDSEQSYDLALDRFKIELGLPLSVEFEIGEEVPPVVKVEIDADAAVNAALHNRLDMATQRDQLDDTIRGLNIAKNNLLPSLDLSASASIGADGNSLSDLAWGDVSGSFGLTLEIPLDRVSERNSYRSALIGLAQARRSLRETEDNVILGVRDSVRRLKQQRQQIDNDEKNIKTIERRLLRADLDNRAGVGSNRDTVEAAEELTRAKNGLLDRYVTYYVTVLRLRQQLGLLFVDKEGRIVQ